MYKKDFTNKPVKKHRYLIDNPSDFALWKLEKEGELVNNKWWTPRRPGHALKTLESLKRNYNIDGFIKT